jgi:hypothetical protein
MLRGIWQQVFVGRLRASCLDAGRSTIPSGDIRRCGGNIKKRQSSENACVTWVSTMRSPSLPRSDAIPEVRLHERFAFFKAF